MGVGVETRSRASSSNPKKYRRTDSGDRRKGDHVDVVDQTNQDSKEDPVDARRQSSLQKKNLQRTEHRTRKRTRWFPRGNPTTWTITKKKKTQIPARKPLPRKVIMDLEPRTRPRYGQPARKAVMSKIVHRGDVAQEGRRPRQVVMTTWMGA